MLSNVYVPVSDFRRFRIRRRRNYLVSRLPIALELRESLRYLRSLLRG
jgi:hypothetical protein